MFFSFHQELPYNNSCRLCLIPKLVVQWLRVPDNDVEPPIRPYREKCKIHKTQSKEKPAKCKIHKTSSLNLKRLLKFRSFGIIIISEIFVEIQDVMFVHQNYLAFLFHCSIVLFFWKEKQEVNQNEEILRNSFCFFGDQ